MRYLAWATKKSTGFFGDSKRDEPPLRHLLNPHSEACLKWLKVARSGLKWPTKWLTKWLRVAYFVPEKGIGLYIYIYVNNVCMYIYIYACNLVWWAVWGFQGGMKQQEIRRNKEKNQRN